MARLCVYFLVGPTAVGKSAVAQRIAETQGFAVLSADSMLVYRGMDIGTSKPSAAERACVPYFGLDLIEPCRTFSVWDYRAYARDVIESCGREGLGVIVVGGTGLYVKSLTAGLRGGPGADEQLREHWAREVEAHGVRPLQQALRETDSAALASIGREHTARRLVRALEVARAGGSGPGGEWAATSEASPMAALTLSMPRLKSRIESRAQRMYAEGLVREVRELLDKQGSLSRTARQAIGYAEAAEVVEGRLSEVEAKVRTVRRTVQLARRQKTWFRHKNRVEWIEADTETDLDGAVASVTAHWREHGPTAIAE